jgi:hypothetical protein
MVDKGNASLVDWAGVLAHLKPYPAALKIVVSTWNVYKGCVGYLPHVRVGSFFLTMGGGPRVAENGEHLSEIPESYAPFTKLFEKLLSTRCEKRRDGEVEETPVPHDGDFFSLFDVLAGYKHGGGKIDSYEGFFEHPELKNVKPEADGFSPCRNVAIIGMDLCGKETNRLYAGDEDASVELVDPDAYGMEVVDLGEALPMNRETRMVPVTLWNEGEDGPVMKIVMAETSSEGEVVTLAQPLRLVVDTEGSEVKAARALGVRKESIQVGLKRYPVSRSLVEKVDAWIMRKIEQWSQLGTGNEAEYLVPVYGKATPDEAGNLDRLRNEVAEVMGDENTDASFRRMRVVGARVVTGEPAQRMYAATNYLPPDENHKHVVEFLEVLKGKVSDAEIRRELGEGGKDLGRKKLETLRMGGAATVEQMKRLIELVERKVPKMYRVSKYVAQCSELGMNNCEIARRFNHWSERECKEGETPFTCTDRDVGRWAEGVKVPPVVRSLLKTVILMADHEEMAEGE